MYVQINVKDKLCYKAFSVQNMIFPPSHHFCLLLLLFSFNIFIFAGLLREKVKP